MANTAYSAGGPHLSALGNFLLRCETEGEALEVVHGVPDDLGDLHADSSGDVVCLHAEPKLVEHVGGVVCRRTTQAARCGRRTAPPSPEENYRKRMDEKVGHPFPRRRIRRNDEMMSEESKL